MATLPIYDRSGAEVGKYEIDPAELAPRINKQLLHDVVVMYQSNLRLGTFKSKSRAEVAGSTRKLYRQKGTGNARVGPRRTGKRVGGGHTHAKRPRDFSYRLPRKALQLATRMALAAKIRDDGMVVIDDLAFAAPKTRDMATILKTLKLQGTSTLVTTAAYDPNVLRSARNIERVSVASVADLNAYAVIRPRKILITRAALDAVRQAAAAKSTPAGAGDDSSGE